MAIQPTRCAPADFFVMLPHCNLPGFPVKSFLCRVKLINVNFTSHKVTAEIMGGYCAAAASQMRIKYSLSRFGVGPKNPVVKGNGLLGGVNFIIAFIYISVCS